MCFMLKNLSEITKEEMEAMCILATLDDEGHVVLLDSDYEEQDGIRYLKKPLKVDRIEWCYYTMDCASLISDIFDPRLLYVFAFSTTKESTNKLDGIYQSNTMWDDGYEYYRGLLSEELNAID